MILYGATIILGSVGNLAIAFTFVTNKVIIGYILLICYPGNHVYSDQVMLTSRNIFIANLALSDLLLCTFTMPLTLLDLLTKYWPLGPDMDTVCTILKSLSRVE